MSVSFKVFLTNEGTSDPPEVRRFGIDKEVVTNFSYLQEKLQQVYPVLKGRVFNVFWQDTDGDKVKISCDEELIIALTELQAEVRKLYVSLKSGFSAAPNDNIHIGVICDGCQGSIAGIRYKCLDCVNYDLCQKCENKGIHPEHNMIRMPKPTIFRPHFFPRLNRIFNRHSCADRRYQPFKVPVNVESGDEASGNDCHKKCRKMKRSDSEQSSDDCEQKKRKHHKHHNKHPHKHHHHPRGGDHPGHHQNWSDLVYGMMGWDSENQDQNTEAAHIKYLNAIGKTVANVLDPFGVDVEIEIKPKQSNNDKKTEKENENNNKEGQEGNNEDKAKENQKVRFEIPEDNQMNELSNFLSQQKLSESTQDGWTIFNTEENEPQQQQINPQNIAAALSALTNAATTSAENNAASASAQTNAATTSAQNNAVASAPVVPNIYPQLPEKQPPTAPSHPNPIIADALDKMLAMGFTNDGGWLTQLVEAKNGDIYKVLDILQPHTKK